jgi:hypothetical protein
MIGWHAVRETDWQRHFHAYGVAADTPGELRNLTSADASLRADGIYHLNSAVLHQGTIYSVTPAAVQVVAGLLGEPVLREPVDDGTTLADQLAFLADVGTSLEWAGIPEPAPPPSQEELDTLFLHLRDDEDGEDDEGWGSELIGVLMGQAVLALRHLASEVQAAILPFVADAAVEVRRHAINALAYWGAMQPDSTQSRLGADVIQGRLDEIHGRDERAALVLALGKLGRDVARWLDDPDEAVRACAALFVHNERAAAILIEELTHPDRVNAWFAQRPAFFGAHTRFALLGALIGRKVPIEQMLPAALALIAGSHAMTADAEWGRILQVAFPGEAAAFKPGIRPPLPQRLSAAQRAVLDALVANPDLWDPRSGNANLARMKVGLPNVREELIEYCRNTPAA